MGTFTEDIISVEQAETLDNLFAMRVHRTPDGEAFRAYDRKQKQWISYSWKEMSQAVALWQAALRSENLEPGNRVGVLLRNCPEWVMFEQAALSLGLVVVPLYTDDRPDNVSYIIEDAGINLLLIQDAGRWKRLAPAIDVEGALQRVLLLEGGSEAEKCQRNDDRVSIADSWLPESAEYLNRSGDGKDLATIVYTSGTTGRPKGVMLSHYNILSVAHAGLTVIDCYLQDVVLSFLPLSHTLERTVGYYVPMMAGCAIVYSRSVAQLADDLLKHKPTLIISVPRVFERIYGKLQDQLGRGPKIRKKLFEMAVSIGWKHFNYTQGRGRWSPGFLLHGLLDRLVGRKIRDRLGGRLRIAVVGGAALPPKVGEVFLGLGVNLIQGYGLTETSPIISFNTPANNDPASVGTLMRGIDARIGNNDEIVVKSPGVMMGYWNNHAATSQIIDSAGWLHTGDQGRFSEDGFLYITGRLKDILILSNGEKIPPGDMESAISIDPMFEQVLVVGEGRSYMSAIAVVDPNFWAVFAPGKPYDAEYMSSDEVVKEALRRIRRALADFPGYAKIRRVTLLVEPWSIENGMLTPTMKAKRQVILDHYVGDVEKMYSGGLAG